MKIKAKAVQAKAANKNRLTLTWLSREYACDDGKAWFQAQRARTVTGCVTKLVKENKLGWARWLLVNKLNSKNGNQFMHRRDELGLNPWFGGAYRTLKRPKLKAAQLELIAYGLKLFKKQIGI